MASRDSDLKKQPDSNGKLRGPFTVRLLENAKRAVQPEIGPIGGLIRVSWRSRPCGIMSSLRAARTGKGSCIFTPAASTPGTSVRTTRRDDGKTRMSRRSRNVFRRPTGS
jgi:hypothetical protein